MKRSGEGATDKPTITYVEQAVGYGPGGPIRIRVPYINGMPATAEEVAAQTNQPLGDDAA